MTIRLLYVDRQVVVCVKPVGQSSEDCAGGMPELLRSACGGEIYTVHRLDLNVGGVMVYARTRAAAAALSGAIQTGLLEKTYLAIVHGRPEPNMGVLEDLLWKDSGKNKVYIVKRERKGVKRAKLSYEVLEAGEASLVRVRLYTGRSHQIRVQFAGRGWPLVGDHKYGGRDKCNIPALWSHRIVFPHPQDGKPMEYAALPLGDLWESFKVLRIADDNILSESGERLK